MSAQDSSEVAPMQYSVALAIWCSYYEMLGGVMEDCSVPDVSAGEMQVAHDILAMPEMQELRRVLAIGGEDWMRGQSLPESIIAWVLAS